MNRPPKMRETMVQGFIPEKLLAKVFASWQEEPPSSHRQCRKKIRVQGITLLLGPGPSGVSQFCLMA